ncbi:MAG TPA: carboxypeptidase regulatory-like domain-containing protein [Candidatus Acidoferrum sp.]|nr:carboxypeptidase regulatory-like domain-containing protein [Candidatus Acidoferrum sp.]
MKKVIYTLLFIALIFSSALSLRAQTTNGSIEGSVTDPSGGAVAGASVTARNLDTGLTQATTTTQAGIYSLPNLPPGRYTVTVEAPSLKKHSQEGVTVTTGTAIALNIPMQLGAVSESVTVTADASQLQTTTSEIGSTVEPVLVANLPLQVGGTIRNPVQFIELVPGFVGGVDNNPGSNSSDDFKVNGGQEGGTDILVDGVSISLVSPNTQWNKGVSTDAVDEFRVLQSNFSAEYGQSGDGIVSLTVKSGTNQVHGSAYDYLRNAGLDANSWLNNLTGSKRSVDTQNDFGATFGGPIWIPKVYNGKNKTFFFFAYEGFRLKNGGSSLQDFPNEDFRGGNFAALCTEGFTGGVCNNLSHQLYDPTTHAAIPGDVLTNDPNFTPSKVMTNVFGLLPPTNGGLTSNVLDHTVSSTTANLYDVKIDHAFSDKHRISGGFDYDNTRTGGTSDLGPIFGSSTPQNTRYARISDNYVISPTLVNQALFGFSRRFRGEGSNSIGLGFPEKIGLTGVNNTTFPCMKWGGTTYQVNNCGASQFADNVFQINDAVSWVKGKHSFKFGGEIRMLQFNVRRLTTSSGEFDFAPAQTSSTGNASGVGGNSVASSLFGLSDTTTLNYGNFSGVRYKDFALYAQDTYKLSSKLTLNYGLRYDIDLPASEAFDRFSAVDPKLPNPDAGNILGAYTYFGSGAGRNGRSRPQDIYHKAFGPRLGFAYSINDKTVVRGGYGIFYEALKEGSFADFDGLGFFNRQTVDVTNGGPTQIDNGITHILPATGPFTPGGQNNQNGVILVPSNTGRPADIQTWNLDIQRQVMNNLMVSVAYVGSKGTHLPALNIIPNQVSPSFLALGGDLTMPSSCLTAVDPLLQCHKAIAAGLTLPYANFTGNINQLLRPFPQYGNFQQEDNSFTPDRTGNSTYHAMQLQANKRFAQGLSFLVSYTVSKNITDADSAGPGVSGFIGTNSFMSENSYNRKAEKAVSQLDTPQSLVASFFYELPLGHGKRYMNDSTLKDRVFGGWYTSAILSYHSGTPTEVYGDCQGTAGDVLFGGCKVAGAPARVNIVPGVPQTNKSNFNPTTTPFWNPAAFTPATNCATSVTTCTFGNEPRSLSTARSFGGRNEDFTIGKKTRLIGEKATIDFQASFFNLFNRHIYSESSNAFSSSLQTPFLPAGHKDASGKTDCPGPLACGFGATTNSSGPRIIQFGLKLTY